MRCSLAIALIAVGFLASQAAAQAPITQPRVSPYLNLLRGGATPGSNYYNLVRPENEFRNSIQQVQGRTQANQQAIENLQEGAGGLPATGKVVGFMNHSLYFNNAPVGGFGAGGPAVQSA